MIASGDNPPVVPRAALFVPDAAHTLSPEEMTCQAFFDRRKSSVTWS
jgi:hypothetical protein